MLFDNPSINPADLPQTEQASWQALQPSYLKRQLLGLLISQLILLIAGIVFLSVAAFWGKTWLVLTICGVWTLMSVLRLLAIRKGFQHTAYALRERDLLYRSGWLWRQMLVVPFNRVQHCSIQEGLLDKLFGLSSLRVFTAGTSGSDMTIPGLAPQHAQRIKDFLIKRTALDEAS